VRSGSAAAKPAGNDDGEEGKEQSRGQYQPPPQGRNQQAEGKVNRFGQGIRTTQEGVEVMPFKSKAQARYMYANMPRTAAKWAKKTKSIRRLPERKANRR
jgi:hypothetical protein